MSPIVRVASGFPEAIRRRVLPLPVTRSSAGRQKVDRLATKHSSIQTRFGVGNKLEPEPKIKTVL